MFANNIKLDQEVYLSDAYKIIDWLGDEDISEHLNEDDKAIQSIADTINYTNIPILTPLFNNKGSFFMIKNYGYSIGFLKLIPKSEGTEMVFAIGEKYLWGNGLGYAAVDKGLSKAFFDLRAEKIIAKIKINNHRSRRIFQKLGFKITKEHPNEFEYSLSFVDFLKKAA